MKAGWKIKPLGEVLDIQNGFAFASSDFVANGGVPLIRIRDLKRGTGTEVSFVGRYDPTYLVNAGDFLIGMDGEFRCYEWKGASALLNQRVCRLVNFSNHVVPRFLHYGINKYLIEIEDATSFTTVKHLSSKTIKSIQFPLPPLEEQHQIVAVLDEAFEGLARARSHAEANLRDARELLANAVDRLFEAQAGHETRQMRLGSVVTRLTNGYVGPTRNIYVEEGVPYLLARHVRNNQLSFDGRTFIAPSFNEKHKKSKLKLGDVLLVQSGHIGHCAVVPPEHVGHNCHAMIILTTIPEILSGEYLAEVLNTPQMQGRFQEIRTGSTVPHLTCKMVKELTIPVPTLPDQGIIIDEIQGLRAECDDLERRYRAKLQSIEALQQSLLLRAFTGELT